MEVGEKRRLLNMEFDITYCLAADTGFNTYVAGKSGIIVYCRIRLCVSVGSIHIQNKAHKGIVAP